MAPTKKQTSLDASKPGTKGGKSAAPRSVVEGKSMRASTENARTSGARNITKPVAAQGRQSGSQYPKK